jgi:hypothetical protein
LLIVLKKVNKNALSNGAFVRRVATNQLKTLKFFHR